MGEEQIAPLCPYDATGAPVDDTSATSPPCGCLARSDREPSPTRPPDDLLGSQPEPGEAAVKAPADPQPPTGDPRRPLKLVLHLQPICAAGYRALLALGTDGCDPLLRAAEVADLAAALAEIPQLVAEAEARWQAQPRYPGASPKARTAATPSRARATRPARVASEACEAAMGASAAKVAGEPTSKPAPAGQLTLFG